MLMNIFISTITAISWLWALTVNAADCSGDKGKHPDIQQAWHIREAMCGQQNACDGQSSSACSLTLPFKDGTRVFATRKSSSSKYSYCWDALENMIRQCFDDGSVSYSGSQHQTSGVYDYNGEHYTLSIQSSSNYAGSNDEPRQEAMVIGVDEDPDTPGGDYVWGPTKYCIGLGPGGGQSCTNVPSGCYIISSFDNTIPNPPICG